MFKYKRKTIKFELTKNNYKYDINVNDIVYTTINPGILQQYITKFYVENKIDIISIKAENTWNYKFHVTVKTTRENINKLAYFLLNNFSKYIHNLQY